MDCTPSHHGRSRRLRRLEDRPKPEPPTTAPLRITAEGRAALAALRAAGHRVDVDLSLGAERLESEDGP